MFITEATSENEANIINTLQQMFIQVMTAMKQGRSFILSGVVDGNDPAPMNFAATYGKPEDIKELKKLFLKNADDIVKEIDKVFIDEKRPPKTEVIKKEDGGIIINFNK